MTTGRLIAGSVAGIVVGGMVVAVVEGAGHALFSGTAVFAAPILGYALGAGVGTRVACRLADRRASPVAPLGLGMLGTADLLAFPHPVWFAPTALLALATGWFAGTRQ